MMKVIKNRVVVPLLLHICMLCMLCVLVTLPPVWHSIYRVTMGETLSRFEHGRLYLKDSALISDGLWSKESYGVIAGKLKGARIGEKEQKHFEDVRKLLRTALYLSVGLSMVLWMARKHIHWPTVWSHALFLFIGEALVSIIWIGISWRHMFRTLHWWIFQNDSWILPNKSYTLYLYPHAVWKALGTVVFSSLLVIILCGFGVTRRQKALCRRGRQPL